MARRSVFLSGSRYESDCQNQEYDAFVSRKTFLSIWEHCQESLKGCKGLEIVHVETHDGTYVSIKL